MVTIYSSCIAEQNGKRENHGSSRSMRKGMEMLTNAEIDSIANESVKRTVTLFDAIKPDAGEMEIVLGPGESGILLHEAMGHGFEADFNRIKTSIFCDKLNKKIASDYVTIIDSGLNTNFRGTINVDDEANEGAETVMVENGVLKSYLHDRISAKHYGVKPTGNGRRDTFRNMPIPRMRNTFMKNGPHTPEEIIASVKNGIYAEQFTNGQVNIGAGDFTFYVKSGNIIENGKLGRPIKDVNIIGNGPKALADIVMVGNDMKMSEASWTCGKGGQGAPVSMGIPTVKISKITVGGVSK
jgi:TldD protein